MRSKLPKVLHKVCGTAMVEHVIDAVQEMHVSKTVIVIGHGAEQVEDALAQRCSICAAAEQLGTGHAVMQSVAALPDEGMCFCCVAILR